MDTDTRCIQKDRLQFLLQQMIDIYSPSGKESEILEFLEKTLKNHSLSYARVDVDENRYDLVVWPKNRDVHCAFIGHVDTVPAFDLDQYQFRMENDHVFGLGAADMKGGCAAMIEAFLSFQNAQGILPAALVLVVGEEESGDGTEAFLQQYNVPWAIVAEPTALVPCLSHYGYLEMDLTISGKRLHASLSNRDHNAINKLLNTLLSIIDHLENHRNDVIYNLRDIQSSEAGFTVPDRCSSSIDIHAPPYASLGDIIFEIEDRVKKQLNTDPLDPSVLNFETIDAGYEIPEKGYLPELLMEVYESRRLPWDTDSFRSHSDANLLWASGVKPIILGPGYLTEAHTPTESAPFGQIADAASLYYDILHKLV